MRRQFKTPEARAAWLSFLIENERVDAAVRLGWSGDGQRPNELPKERIERAWLELEAAVVLQSYIRARLAARLYRERLRKLNLFRLYARTEARAARAMQQAFRRRLASRAARYNWLDALNAAAPDPQEAASRLARAAALVQNQQRMAHRAALLAKLHGTLHVRNCNGRFTPLRRFRERHVFVVDGAERPAICWRKWEATSTERTVPIGAIRVHSDVRYEFELEEAAPGGRIYLFRCRAQHTLEDWVRNLHTLMLSIKPTDPAHAIS